MRVTLRVMESGILIVINKVFWVFCETYIVSTFVLQYYFCDLKIPGLFLTYFPAFI